MPTLYINGHEANLDAQEFASFHGTSVFTTMRSKKEEIMLFERHWRRLSLHAAYFGFVMPKQEIISRLLSQELKSKNSHQKIRIIVSRLNWAITLEDAEVINSNIYNGVKICISQFRTHPQFAGFKTGNSLPYILALEEAKKQGVFEALLLDNQGRISDGSRTSLMLYDGHKLISLLGGLEGCMREEILGFAQGLGVDVERCYLKPRELCGQLLLANSLIGLVPVGAVTNKLVLYLVDLFRTDKN